MHQQLRVGIERLCLGDVVGGDAGVNRAAAVEQLDVFVGTLRRHMCAEVAVGNKENVFVGNPVDDFDRRGAGDADVADGFERGGCVDIGDDGVVGIVLFDLFNQRLVHLVCHGAACNGRGEDDGLFGRENLAGLRHKAHAAHENVLVVSLGGVHAQLVAVAGKVGDFADFTRLIAVSENADVLFLFEPEDFLLKLRNIHSVSFLSLYGSMGSFVFYILLYISIIQFRRSLCKR